MDLILSLTLIMYDINHSQEYKMLFMEHLSVLW